MLDESPTNPTALVLRDSRRESGSVAVWSNAKAADHRELTMLVAGEEGCEMQLAHRSASVEKFLMAVHLQ
jgi:hypothetical protein